MQQCFYFSNCMDIIVSIKRAPVDKYSSRAMHPGQIFFNIHLDKKIQIKSTAKLPWDYVAMVV